MQSIAEHFAGHVAVNYPGYIARMSYDPTTISVLRRALDEVLIDARFHRASASALEVAEHLLSQAKAGERDLERLKSSVFRKFSGDGVRVEDRAA